MKIATHCTGATTKVYISLYIIHIYISFSFRIGFSAESWRKEKQRCLHTAYSPPAGTRRIDTRTSAFCHFPLLGRRSSSFSALSFSYTTVLYIKIFMCNITKKVSFGLLQRRSSGILRFYSLASFMRWVLYIELQRRSETSSSRSCSLSIYLYISILYSPYLLGRHWRIISSPSIIHRVLHYVDRPARHNSSSVRRQQTSSGYGHCRDILLLFTFLPPFPSCIFLMQRCIFLLFLLCLFKIRIYIYIYLKIQQWCVPSSSSAFWSFTNWPWISVNNDTTEKKERERPSMRIV